MSCPGVCVGVKGLVKGQLRGGGELGCLGAGRVLVNGRSSGGGGDEGFGVVCIYL